MTFFGIGSTFVDISAIIIVTFTRVTSITCACETTIVIGTSSVSIAVIVTIGTFVLVNTFKSVNSEIASALVGTWNVGTSGPFVTAVQVIGSTLGIIDTFEPTTATNSDMAFSFELYSVNKSRSHRT